MYTYIYIYMYTYVFLYICIHTYMYTNMYIYVIHRRLFEAMEDAGLIHCMIMILALLHFMFPAYDEVHNVYV